MLHFCPQKFLLNLSVSLVAFAMALSPSAFAQLDSPFSAEQEEDGAEAQCELQLDQPSTIFFRGASSRGYSSTDSRIHIERGDLKIRHRGAACAYILQIEPADGSAQPEMRSVNDAIRFDIRAEGRQGNASNQMIELHGNFYESQVIKTAAFEISIPTGQSALAGDYSGELIATLFIDNDGIKEFISSGPMRVTTHVQPRVSASIGQDASGGQHSANLNFGQLRSGEQKNLSFTVAANTYYQVAFKSLNEGRLRHAHTSSLLDYEISIDGHTLQRDSLADGTPVMRGQQSSQHDVAIEITGKTATALAGHYSDLLTIVISAE